MTAAGLVEVADPVPGPGQARIDVLAAGVCHSDLHVLDSGAGSGWALPFTLGHEICGRVAAVGPGVADLVVGDRVVVHAPYGCGRCARWGSRAELAEVVELARRGLLPVRATAFELAEADRAFDELRRGRVVGRAVLVPDRGA